jgi:dihydrofolate reductase
LKIDGVEVVNSLEKAILKTDESSEIFIIGGQQIYSIALPLATHMYITKVNGIFDGDAFFPDYVEDEWIEIAREDLITDKDLRFSFLKYEKLI